MVLLDGDLVSVAELCRGLAPGKRVQAGPPEGLGAVGGDHQGVAHEKHGACWDGGEICGFRCDDWSDLDILIS